jgi:hypothetical protein
VHAELRRRHVANEATRIVRDELARASSGGDAQGADGGNGGSSTVPRPRGGRVLNADQFADAATITTGAIYQVWPTQADFQVDLLFHIAELNATSDSVIDELPPMIATAAAEGRPVEEALRATITRSFEYTRQSALFYTTLCFYKHSANARVKQAMQRSTDAFIDAVRPVYQQLLDTYDLQVRSPYSVDNLAVTIGALIEGLSLEWATNPSLTQDPLGQDGWSLTTRAAQMIFSQMTCARAPRDQLSRFDA